MNLNIFMTIHDFAVIREFMDTVLLAKPAML
ncbi:hypothetical protein Metfor_0899 [Methanoregula formicica SMSP]|uniref:Uncharacterized protein n=1 Tax=Methanoregula formicica (strain DSM 22288 / NBRC 105244 / SMSP) TaxID=593750 RepID=L0HFT7_METFS|nr:hypothetical protein Metfor_0899 [Methanoregula formicica SMSP]